MGYLKSWPWSGDRLEHTRDQRDPSGNQWQVGQFRQDCPQADGCGGCGDGFGGCCAREDGGEGAKWQTIALIQPSTIVWRRCAQQLELVSHMQQADEQPHHQTDGHGRKTRAGMGAFPANHAGSTRECSARTVRKARRNDNDNN